MRKNSILTIAILLLFCIAFSSCEAKNESPFVDTDYPTTVGDIIIHTQPKRIVSLSPSYSEIIFELGYGDTLVGRSGSCNYPEKIKALPVIDSGLSFNAQQVIDLKPNLLITQTSLSSKDLETLYQNNIQVLTLTLPTSIEGIEEIYSELAYTVAGQLKGPKIAQQSYKKFDDGLKAIKKAMPKDKLSFIYSINLDEIFATNDTFEGSVLSVIGNNFITNGSKYSADFGENKINPNIVFIPSPYEVIDAKDSKALKSISAVKKDEVYIIDPNSFNIRSIRLIDNIKAIAKQIYHDIKL